MRHVLWFHSRAVLLRTQGLWFVFQLLSRLFCWLYLMILAQNISNFYKQFVIMKHSKSTYASVDSAALYFADKTNQILPLKNFTNF